MFNQTYSGSVPANSTLIFDAEGSSLTLSLHGNIIGHATDSTLASTAGGVGMFTSSGAVMSNFIAAPVTGAAPAALATVNGISNAKKTVSVTIKKVKTGHGVNSVRPVHEKLGHAHRAELGHQSGHGQPRQRDDGERQSQHHSK